MIPVAVLGGGPAGLAAAYGLERAGLRHRVLEAGEEPLAGLRRVDQEMRLLSPARLSRLPGMAPGELGSTYPTFGEYVAAVEAWRRRHGIEVETHRRVERVERLAPERADGSGRDGAEADPGGARFRVRWTSPDGEPGELTARWVINATGIVSTPALPAGFLEAWPGWRPGGAGTEGESPGNGGTAGEPTAGSSPPWRVLHARDARSRHLASAERLLVVGGGASALEVIEGWLASRRPRSHAWLSLRSPLRAVPHRILGVDVHYLGWLPEHLPLHLLPPPLRSRAARLPEPMLSRAVPRAIRRGLVTRTGPVSDWTQLSLPPPVGPAGPSRGGARLVPDLVVFATGYRYRVDHLGDLVELRPDGGPRVHRSQSPAAPGLFLLGTRFGRTFASPYLRGIPRDARNVVGRIVAEAG